MECKIGETEREREKGREGCNSECKNEERARDGGVILSVK